MSRPISAAFSFSLVALVGVPRSYWQVSLIVAPALSTTPAQHEAVIGTVNRASMWELRRRRVHSSAPSSACARPDHPSGFSRPPVWVFKVPRARPEPFPNAAEISRDIEFLTVRTSCRPEVSCLNWLR
jgi:hypothetical protein